MAGIHAVLAGAAASFVFRQTISVNQGPYNLKSAAIAAGWNQNDSLDAIVTINSGVAVGASSTGGYAFDTGSTFPPGTLLRLNMAGAVASGVGGAGGAGQGNPSQGSGGAAGGPCLIARHPITIDAAGATLAGGGGGGGGGVFSSEQDPKFGTFYYSGSGGGGGRSSIVANAAGGPGGPNFSPGAPGGTGTYSGPGGGGGGRGPGGIGGGWGAGGASPYYSGGAGGIAIAGNAFITWINTGTRLGAIT